MDDVVRELAVIIFGDTEYRCIRCIVRFDDNTIVFSTPFLLPVDRTGGKKNTEIKEEPERVTPVGGKKRSAD